MKRTDGDAFVAITSSHGVTPVNGFGEGDPTVPTNPSQVKADFLNNLQEELMTILDQAAIAPDGTVFNQLFAALKLLFVSTHDYTGGTGQGIAGPKIFSGADSSVVFGSLCAAQPDFQAGALLEQRSIVASDFAAALIANELSARAVHKAHAVVTLNGTAAPALSAADSYNVTGVAIATNALVVTLAGGANFFASGAKPCVTVTVGSELLGAQFVLPTVQRALSDRTKVVINFSDASAAVLNGAAAGLNGLTVNVHVEGKQ